MEPNKRSWGTEVRNSRWDLSLLLLGFLMGVGWVLLMNPMLFIRSDCRVVLTIAAAIALIYWRLSDKSRRS
jgi:hypothetical protein